MSCRYQKVFIHFSSLTLKTVGKVFCVCVCEAEGETSCCSTPQSFLLALHIDREQPAVHPSCCRLKLCRRRSLNRFSQIQPKTAKVASECREMPHPRHHMLHHRREISVAKGPCFAMFFLTSRSVFIHNKGKEEKSVSGVQWRHQVASRSNWSAQLRARAATVKGDRAK